MGSRSELTTTICYMDMVAKIPSDTNLEGSLRQKKYKSQVSGPVSSGHNLLKHS